jgi:hypothetical protein
MARPKGPLTKAVKEQLQIAQAVPITDVQRESLTSYLREQIPIAIRSRDELLPRIEKWRKTIAGKRASGMARNSHTSNLSVPLTIWARVAVRARITESILTANKVVGMEPIPGRDQDEDSNQTIANNMATFLNSQILSSRGLNGKTVIEKAAAEMVDLGASAIKVFPEPGTVRNVRPASGARNNKGKLKIIAPRVRWEHISWTDLVFVDGYGTDTQAMPFIGHQFNQNWSQMQSWANMGHYEPAAIAAVESHFANKDANKPAAVRDHDLIELYLDWATDETGVESALLVTWHEKAQIPVRIVWSPISDGTRPILISRFDLPEDMTMARGQGVSEKLEGPQDEVDAIHNIGIEAGKRGVAHVIVLKEGTRAEEEFGGDTDILPGDVIVTGTPDEDIKAVPLGDTNAAMAAVQLEEHTRVYVTRILGLDESRMGNVESGKRVTAQVGMTSIREGRMIIRAALGSFADMLAEAGYLTLDLYKQVPPIQALRAALAPEAAQAVVEAVFAVDDLSMRSSFLLRINAQDAAISEENRKQEMLIINQALFPFYDRIQSIIIALANPELPPEAKKPLTLLVGRMERGMEALLNTVDAIPNPEELLISVGEIEDMIKAQSGEELTEEPFGEEAEQSLIGDLGAGVV